MWAAAVWWNRPLVDSSSGLFSRRLDSRVVAFRLVVDNVRRVFITFYSDSGLTTDPRSATSDRDRRSLLNRMIHRVEIWIAIMLIDLVDSQGWSLPQCQDKHHWFSTVTQTQLWESFHSPQPVLLQWNWWLYCQTKANQKTTPVAIQRKAETIIQKMTHSLPSVEGLLSAGKLILSVIMLYPSWCNNIWPGIAWILSNILSW